MGEEQTQETILKANSMEEAINGDFTEGMVTPEAELQNKFTTEPPAVEEKSDVVEGDTKTVEDTNEPSTEEPIQVEVKTIEEPVQPIIQEKIIEKPIEFKDEKAEQLYQAITGGGEEAEKAVLSYLNSKYKDYNTMDSLSVLKEKLSLDKPHWDSEDINDYIEQTYGDYNLSKIDLSLLDKEDNEEEYNKAERHNKEVDRLSKLRDRDAKDARIYLESQKQNIELPTFKKQEDVEVPQLTPEQIQENLKLWSDKVDLEMEDFSDIKVKVGNEEITYKFTDEEKSAQIEYMKTTNTSEMFRDLGWIKDDGTDDVRKIAEDVRKLKDFNKIMSAVGTTIKTAVKKEVIAKDIKNIDLENKSTTVDTPKQDVGDYILSL